ncbi:MULTISPECIES: helix-turn-helix transcriptional regulator [unclassified Acidovorax]|uniref:helix-turn-helix transcriptional regulator n=1 Tax=unclassified Acidovorax TaxID=2684926 RepID=UPI002102A373|nr:MULTISPECIES: helix-turn-helix transcriptional regulator [unclassified Acidovorax]
MPTPRRATQAAAHLRQLACLDATGPHAIAPVLGELHHLIGFDAGCLIHPGAGGEMEVFVESPVLQAAMPDYFDRRILASEARVMHRGARLFQEALRVERGALMLPQMAKVPLSELVRSDFFNAVLRPGDVGDGLKLPLHTRAGQGVGMLWLYRREADRRFTPEDAAALGRLEPVLARALQPLDPGEAGGDSEVCGQGLLVVSPDGRLQWMSPEAQALLALALGTRWRAGGGSDLPDVARLLVQRLFWPATDGEAPLPDVAVRNAHGAFSLRATRLAGVAGAGEAAAIHITRRVPRGTRLLAHLRAQDLPRRQAELAYWLVRGAQESQIAERMGVSINTVAYHRRQLYDALGVQGRQGLAERLLPPPSTTTPLG